MKKWIVAGAGMAVLLSVSAESAKKQPGAGQDKVQWVSNYTVASPGGVAVSDGRGSITPTPSVSPVSTNAAERGSSMQVKGSGKKAVSPSTSSAKTGSKDSKRSITVPDRSSPSTNVVDTVRNQGKSGN